MPKDQRGIVHILGLLVAIAAIGVVSFLLLASSAPFRDKLFSLLFPKPSSHAEEPLNYADGELLVEYKTGVTSQAKDRIAKLYNLTKIDSLSGGNIDRFQIPSQNQAKGKVTHAGHKKAHDKLLQTLKKNKAIKFVEKNYIRQLLGSPNDPYFVNGSQWNLTAIGLPEAWDINTGNSSSAIGIIDSGIDSSHEDLAPKVQTGLNIPLNSNDTSDRSGHGSAVAGIAAAATGNSKGIAGVAQNNPLIPLKITDQDGVILDSYVVNALNYAATSSANIKVVNMSFGFSTPSQILQSAIDNAWSKNIVLVAAAGDRGVNGLDYPAVGNHVISVGALDQNNTRAVFSNYGSGLDVMAPGVGIYSTKTLDGYGQFYGTSFAAPQVSGLAALMLSANPALLNSEVESLIEQTADDLGPNGRDDEYGYGRINAGAALKKAIENITPDTSTPSATITSPASNATISQIVNISVDASDNVGVTKVEIYADNNLLGTDFGSPYSASWDSSLVNNGSHNILVKAYDGAGNVGSFSLVVNVNNSIPDTTLPTTTITNPTAGSAVSSTTTIQATASDNIEVASVSFFVDGIFIGQAISSPYSVSWDTTDFINGSHTIQSKALDSSSNIGESTLVNVSVNNQNFPPPPTSSPTPTSTPLPSNIPSPSAMPTLPPVLISFSQPSNGAIMPVGKNITLKANTQTGITKVEFYIDTSRKCSDTSAPFTCTWGVPSTPGISYTLTAKGYNSLGLVVASSFITVISGTDTINPTTTIISPKSGLRVSVNVNTIINARASDEVGISKLEFYINGSRKCSDTSTDANNLYSCVWKVPATTGLSYTLTTKAYDYSGNIGNSANVVVTSQ